MRYIYCLHCLLIFLHFQQNSHAQIYKFENPDFALIKRLETVLTQTTKDDYWGKLGIGYYLGNGEDRAVMIDYSFESGRPRLSSIYITPARDVFQSFHNPVYWLGSASEDESIDVIIHHFRQNEHLRSDILNLLTHHQYSARIREFIVYILCSDYPARLKERCLDMFDRNPSPDNEETLMKIIHQSQNKSLTRRAIYSLSLLEDETAMKTLFSLVRDNRDKNIKKEAIFCLGQMRSFKALTLLYDIVQSDEDQEILKFAVFTISQHPDANSYDMLKKIELSHKNSEVRLKAFYWLTQLEGHKASDFH